VTEVSDLPMENVERHRQWDSCFNPDFSSMHGGVIRDDIRSRYRQWLTHKLALWHDQFGTSGCVGCGRCITWCPVGIDITESTFSPGALIVVTAIALNMNTGTVPSSSLPQSGLCCRTRS
jgi:ferredoxin